MYFTLMGKLSARRQNLTADKDKGFTLIELLVVVIIIGILAAIAIPVYLGVQNNAKNSATKSDITNIKTAAISLATSAGKNPDAVAAKTGFAAQNWADAGATVSTNTKTVKYTPAADGTFCIEGASEGGGTFSATDKTGVVDGACAK